MLPKQNRVSEREVGLLFKQAKSIRTPFFVVRYIPNTSFKCGVIAPKTIAKTAVLRNKLRRQWYGVIEKVQKTLKIQGIFVFVLNKEAIELDPITKLKSVNDFFIKNQK